MSAPFVIYVFFIYFIIIFFIISAKLWERKASTAEFECQRQFIGHTGSIYAVTFIPHSSDYPNGAVITGAADHTVCTPQSSSVYPLITYSFLDHHLGFSNGNPDVCMPRTYQQCLITSVLKFIWPANLWIMGQVLSFPFFIQIIFSFKHHSCLERGNMHPRSFWAWRICSIPRIP